MKMSGTSRRPHVVTSQHRKFGSTNIKVNKRQRRDVSTLRRLNVSAGSVFSSLKEKRDAEFVASGIIRTRARKSEQQ